MNVKLFGPRCLVEFHKLNTTSKIIIPDVAQNADSHRTGIVRFVGDGKVKGKDEPVPALVKPGDVVMFQLNGIVEATQKFVIDGKHYLNLLQDDLLARINGDDMALENLTMLGDYVLLKHFLRERPGSTLFLPDQAVRQSAPEFIYFRCIQKGERVTRDFNLNDEVVVNFGRLTPMFIVKRNADGTSENQEFCYTRQEWVDGVVEAENAEQPQPA
jgi:co-chaperonin GroES (HSP10)